MLDYNNYSQEVAQLTYVSATSGIFIKNWKYNVQNKMVRFNFLEAVVRMAKAKYVDLLIPEAT